MLWVVSCSRPLPNHSQAPPLSFAPEPLNNSIHVSVISVSLCINAVRLVIPPCPVHGLSVSFWKQAVRQRLPQTLLRPAVFQNPGYRHRHPLPVSVSFSFAPSVSVAPDFAAVALLTAWPTLLSARSLSDILFLLVTWSLGASPPCEAQVWASDPKIVRSRTNIQQTHTQNATHFVIYRLFLFWVALLFLLCFFFLFLLVVKYPSKRSRYRVKIISCYRQIITKPAQSLLK